MHDIRIIRPHPGAPFGFGVASMWRIDGRVKVISWVDPNGPAAGALEVEDALVSINGTDIDDLDLEQVKEELRKLGGFVWGRGDVGWRNVWH